MLDKLNKGKNAKKKIYSINFIECHWHFSIDSYFREFRKISTLLDNMYGEALMEFFFAISGFAKFRVKKVQYGFTIPY